MMAGFAAAYMSTVATQLNWGASYLVNDVWRRFIRREASERHYVAASRATTVLLFLLSIIVTWQIDSVGRAWKMLIGLGAGTGLVYMLRWYWWRINAWSEVSAMVASFVTYIVGSNIVPRFFPDPRALPPAQAALAEGIRNRTESTVLLITVAVSTLTWLATTFLTAPESRATLRAFYERVRPGGPGWVSISEELGYGREPIPGGSIQWVNWVAGIVAVYASLFGIGKIVFGYWGAGIALLVLAAAAFAWIARSFREDPTLRAGAVREPAAAAAD
jgi:hypothetical protein